jgi:hypothetical protein
VILPNVAKNPQSTKPSTKFTVQTSLLEVDDQLFYLVDYDATTLLVTADTPNTLQSVSVTRNDIVINDPSDFVLAFTTVNPIPKNSILTIQMPKD